MKIFANSKIMTTKLVREFPSKGRTVSGLNKL